MVVVVPPAAITEVVVVVVVVPPLLPLLRCGDGGIGGAAAAPLLLSAPPLLWWGAAGAPLPSSPLSCGGGAGVLSYSPADLASLLPFLLLSAHLHPLSSHSHPPCNTLVACFICSSWLVLCRQVETRQKCILLSFKL